MRKNTGHQVVWIPSAVYWLLLLSEASSLNLHRNFLCEHTCNSVTSFLSASWVNVLCMLDRINCFWAFTSGFHLWDAKMFLGSCSMSNRRARSLSCWVKFFDRCLEGFWAIAVRTTGSSGSSYPWNRSRFKYGTELFNGTVNERRMIIYLHHLEVHRNCRRAKCRCIGIFWALEVMPTIAWFPTPANAANARILQPTKQRTQ